MTIQRDALNLGLLIAAGAATAQAVAWVWFPEAAIHVTVVILGANCALSFAILASAMRHLKATRRCHQQAYEHLEQCRSTRDIYERMGDVDKWLAAQQDAAARDK